MEVQFQVNQIPILRQLKSEMQTQEQTQEVRLNDSMPDMGRVLAAWGQMVIRGKEWHGEDMGVTGGVMAWVLYAPEDGGQAQCVECWIPVNIKWEIPPTDRDGSIMCHGLVKSVDARILSSRKMMVRATVGVLGQAYAPDEIPNYIPEQIPGDIQLQERIYPICLAREAGEKAFMMDEELTMPSTAPALDKLIRFSLVPEVTDQKVLGDKVVFRGNTALHILYRTPEGALASWDFEIPFSQYSELQQEYGHQAQAQLMPVVTSLELEPGEQGRLRLKAGVSGQYLIYDTQDISVIEDAYSPDRTVTVKQEMMELPAVLERQTQPVRAEYTGNFSSSRVADVEFNPGLPRKQKKPEEMALEIPGMFQTLYYDPEGVLQASSNHWQMDMTMPMGENDTMELWCSLGARPLATPGAESTSLRGEMQLNTVTCSVERIPAVTGLNMGEITEKDPLRPSLILQKAGQEDLWTIAKKCGSTVNAIREANGLSDDPDPDRILLIPVL